MRPKLTRIILSLGLAFLATLLILASLNLSPIRAADQCVAPGGAGSCLASIQAAIDAANSGDTVSVVAGTYTENVVISKTIFLLGGFDDTFLSTRTPRSSTIQGGGVDSVVKILNGAHVTLDGFTITGGRCHGQWRRRGRYLNLPGGGHHPG